MLHILQEGDPYSSVSELTKIQQHLMCFILQQLGVDLVK